MISKQFDADASVCYLLIDDNYIELFASHNINPKLINNITLKVGEGIIGGIAQSKLTTEVENIWQHPNFLYREGVDEEKFKSFLGTPVLRWGRSIGVLGLYQKEIYNFKKEEVHALEMLAMEFSDWLASDEVREYKNTFIRKKGHTTRDTFKGLSLSRGYGYGPAVVHRRRHAVTKIFADNKDVELERLQKAHTQMNIDLDEKFNQSKLGIGEHADILDAYRMFAKDKGWYNKIAGHVEAGLTSEAAVERAYEDMWNRLSATQDTYLKERLHDLRDVADRLLGYLFGDTNDITPTNLDGFVVVAQMMGPADLMDYDYHKIRALVLEDGTATMHVAIVAKALGIPVVSKIKSVFSQINNGELLAVNGDDGIVYIRPDEKIIEAFEAKINERKEQIAQLAELRKLPAKTLDKKRINTYLYIDIFPLDGLPDKYYERKKHKDRVMREVYLLYILKISKYKINESSRVWSRIFWIMISIIGNKINSEKIIQHIERKVQKYDFYKSKYCGVVVAGYGEQEFAPRIIFECKRRLKFRDRKFLVFQGAEYYLTNLYDDYMTLPPENKRIFHGGIAYKKEL